MCFGANSAPLQDQEQVVFYEQVGWGRGDGLLSVYGGENPGQGRMPVQKEAEEHTLGGCGPEPEALGS